MDQLRFLGTIEGRYTFDSGLIPLLRFSGLTSVTNAETNNAGLIESDMHIGYFLTVQPGVQYQFHLTPEITLAPELAWDFDWYEQNRSNSFVGEVSEDVSWLGPSIGGEVAVVMDADWTAELRYRHSFLFDVTADNSFTSGLGFGDASTDGDRDIVQVRSVWHMGPRWDLIVGYRFESARINAGDTQVRTVSGRAVAVQFPDNEHTLHGLDLGARFAF